MLDNKLVAVQRHKREGRGHLSYVLQEENEIAPILALEFVSKTYGQEYGEKMSDYAQLGVKYYILYNPEYSKRDKHDPFEVYKLVEGQYQLQKGEPVWLPEIELGIGRVQGKLGGITREWLAWHDGMGKPYLLPQELIRQQSEQLAQERLRATQIEETLLQERLEKLQLLEKLRQLGVNMEEI